MARQQRFDWFLSQQRRRKVRKKAGENDAQRKQRRPVVEVLEPRELLSVNCGQLSSAPTDSGIFEETSTVVVATSNAVAHDHDGDGIADHAAQDHDPGCCCPQCVGMASVATTLDLNGESDPTNHDPGCCCEQCLGISSTVSHDHDGDGIADHAPEDHDPGCCCEQCLGIETTLHSHSHHHHHGHSHPDGFWASEAEYLAATNGGFGPQEFNASPEDAWVDPDPETPGFQITYSYSNFLDGTLFGGLSTEQLVAATEEAFGLWASVAPLHFVEVVDTGPPADDEPYDAAAHPLIRIGHHFIDGGSSVLAHAFFPSDDGLGGDVHFDNGDIWNINPNNPGIDVIEVMTHELGHALGLGHETELDAIMNPFYGGRYNGLGTGFLLPDDIGGIQFLYGEGEGSVTPLRIVVDTNVDENDGDFSEGDLSLREALVRAKELDRAQIITFDESLTNQTIVLDPSLGALVVDDSVVIEGLGADQLSIVAPNTTTADGDGIQIFVVDDSDEEVTLDVTISGLSLSGGDSATAGGAIYSVENLVLDGVSIEDSFSAVAGGAIYATMELRIFNSTLANSRTDGDGGAIAVEGQNTVLIVDTSTVSGNSAERHGGAIYSLDENPEVFRILNSTVYDNHADSDSNGSGTGGGVWMLDGVLALEDTIVAANTDNGTAPNLDNVNAFATPKILAKYNLIDDVAGSFLTQQAPNVLGEDPILLPLADNGGPTKTHLPDGNHPSGNSPILNAGNPDPTSQTEFDQRGLGFRRILEGRLDIGAVESGGFVQSFTVNSLLDKSDLDEFGNDTTPEDTTLREAIEAANLELGKNLINFDPALSEGSGTIDLNPSLGEFLISDSLTIDASGFAAGLTINAVTADPTPELNNGDGSRIFRSDDSNPDSYIDLELFGLTLIGGDVSDHGGAIFSSENLLLTEVSILDNYATGNGGGVYHLAGANGGTLRIGSSTFANNEAVQDGGGLWSNTNLPAEPDPDPDPDPITGLIVNSTFSGNVAGDEGGGIMNFDGLLEIRHSTITLNDAAHGSGVVSFGDSFTKTLVYSSIISGNVINNNGTPADETDDTGFDVQRSRNIEFNSFESLGYNLIGKGDALLNFNDATDITEVTDPMLGPLANNGGKTLTHNPLADSPVVDAGDPTLATIDYSGAVLATNPFLYWALDEPAGANFAVDAAGTNPGEVDSAVVGTDAVVFGEVGAEVETFGSAKFDSSVSPALRLRSDNDDLLNTSEFGTSYSFSFWFNPATTDTQTILTLTNPDFFSGMTYEFSIRWDGDSIVAKDLDSPDGDVEGFFVQSEGTLSVDQWYHVAFVRDGGVSKIYIDGELNNSATALGPGLMRDTLLALAEPYDGPGLTGGIDEVLLYDRPLTDEEAKNLHDSAERSVVVTVPFDQRGDAFSRVSDGDRLAAAGGSALTAAVIDIGAVELIEPGFSANFDSDSTTDGSDFLIWQRGVGSESPTFADGDANADGFVDTLDLEIWTEQYGDVSPTNSTLPNAMVPAAPEPETPSLPAARLAHRPATSSHYDPSEILFAAAQDYFSLERHSLSASEKSEATTEGEMPYSPAFEAASGNSPAATHSLRSSEGSGREDDQQIEPAPENSLDKAFASIGVEQPMRFRGF